MSRFVSGGTADEPAERDDAWLKAQQEIEARHRQKKDESRQENGKSLYDTLQANKAAKQDAFEESTRLRNQFRALAEDEVDFLDSVLESTRAQEAAVKKETAEQLDLFRQQQEESQKAAAVDEQEEQPVNQDSWAVKGRKRKSVNNGPTIRFKLAKKQDTASASDGDKHAVALGSSQEAPDATTLPPGIEPDRPKLSDPAAHDKPPTAAMPQVSKPPSPPGGGLGLAAYSSDED